MKASLLTKKHLIFYCIIFVSTPLILLYSRPSNTRTAAISPTPVQSYAEDIPFPSSSEMTELTPTLNPQQRLLQKYQNRKPLSRSDQEAKLQILSNLPRGKQSGMLYTSPAIRIEYTLHADSFDVEIITTDISNAKNEGYAWFHTQGLSHDAICNYPIKFYLSYDVISSKPGFSANFDPLPPGC